MIKLWDPEDVIEESIKHFHEFVGNNLVICNSYEAQKEWNFPNFESFGRDSILLSFLIYEKRFFKAFACLSNESPFYGK